MDGMNTSLLNYHLLTTRTSDFDRAARRRQARKASGERRRRGRAARGRSRRAALVARLAG
jgi:hypothetical protein